MIETSSVIGIDPSPQLWVTDETASSLWGGIPLRTARHRLRNCPRQTQPTGGRPRSVYYIGDIPELVQAAAQRPVDVPTVKVARDARRSLAPDDLAVAQLRSRAVRQYLHMKNGVSEHLAAISICNEWNVRPQSVEVMVEARAKSGTGRRREKRTVKVGGFGPTTLRIWARSYENAGDDLTNQLEALAPARKGNAGAPRSEIPCGLIELVHALAVTGPRADLEKGLAAARARWTGDWPDVSYSTWLRRMRERDPERFTETIGKKGLADFARLNTPDIERDWNSLSFNEEWQLDDVTEDFYGHGSDLMRLMRPFAYAIIRVSTRQWICAVACEAKITQDQVRAMIGYAMASSSGGIPERIRFERGTIACDQHLEETLNDLGIKVIRTSMDRGAVTPNTVDDKSSGHFMGKAVIESHIRRHHGFNAYELGQVGTDERTSMAARNAAIVELSRKMAEEGRQLVLPVTAEWQQLIFNALERANNTPCSGLRETVDPATGETRYMTPNEAARMKIDDAINVLDERCLPIFFRKGVLVNVTKNGFRLNDSSYGRFDEELQQHAGAQVMVYGSREFPDAAYVVELQRCVPRTDKLPVDATSDAYAAKTSIAKGKRSEFVKMIEAARSSSGGEIIDKLYHTRNATPERKSDKVCPQAILDRATSIKSGFDKHEAREQARARRFRVLDDGAEAPAEAARPARRGGLLAKAGEIRGQVAALNGAGREEAEERFTI